MKNHSGLMYWQPSIKINQSRLDSPQMGYSIVSDKKTLVTMIKWGAIYMQASFEQFKQSSAHLVHVACVAMVKMVDLCDKIDEPSHSDLIGQ